MSTLNHLTGAASGTHLADQIALVCVPLIAALAFDAQPATIGVLVACQSLAHLLGSVPFGLLVDQRQLRHLAIIASLLSLSGCALAVASILSDTILGFGISVTLAGFGSVLFGLTALSIIPRIVGPQGLARANAAVEVPRAICSFVVPLLVGFLVSTLPHWGMFLLACLGAAFALQMSKALPDFPIAPSETGSAFARTVEGGRFVLRHPLLLPISLCAVFWNFAFAALLVVLVPAIQDIYALDPGSFGIALSSFGLAAICGSWISGRAAHLVPPSVILLFGPGSSVVAAAGLVLIGSDVAPFWLYALFFLLGFGPSMWLVTQNSVRQMTTPSAMLGRVNAVIQTAIYGVRPIGALLGGVWASQFGVEAGLLLVLAAFIGSFLASAFSGLRRITSFQSLRQQEPS